jgi:uncharacterized sulfatase
MGCKSAKMRRLAVLVTAIAWIAPAILQAQSEKPRRPNILFAIADDASWPHMSAYGCKFISTPAFDRIAREGALFNNCFTPTPKCSPSRAALLTGKNPWQLEDAANHFGLFPAKFKVFPDVLESAGYAVGHTGKGWGPGNFQKGGFKRNPAGPGWNGAKLTPPTSGISDNDYAANFQAFLQSREKDQPFCFWYGGHEPHRLYEPGSGLKAGKKLSDVTLSPYFPDSDEIRSDILDYALEIEWFDKQFGRMLEMLKTAGELENTLIVVTADNGMPFPRVKGHVFEDACHLPLAMRWGGVIKAGRTIDDLVSFIDIAPTFLDAAGVAPSQPMTGRSLVEVLKSDASGQIDPARVQVVLGREREDLGRPGDVGYPVRSLRTREWFYSRNFAPDRWPAGDPETGYSDIDASPTKKLIVDRGEADRFHQLALAKRPAEELYNLTTDPHCVANLAENQSSSVVKARMWAELEGLLKQQQDPRVLGKGDVFDTYESFGNPKTRWDFIVGKKPK